MSGSSQETVLSVLLKNVPQAALPPNAVPHSLHPFTSNSTDDDPLVVLKRLAHTSAVLERTLQGYGSLYAQDKKFISILRQSTALIKSLHNAESDTQRRVKALSSRGEANTNAIHGEPIPLDKTRIAPWFISRIEYLGKKSGMETFKDGSITDRKMTIVLGGKELVIDIDLSFNHQGSIPRVEIANVKTSHALPSGQSENMLAERSSALDAFLMNVLKAYAEEVQSGSNESSMRAAFMTRDACAHLKYLMKLDAFAASEGDSGIRWFNDIGLMSIVADQVFKTEVDVLTSTANKSIMELDIFLSRAHALAVPYLLSPSMSFLVYLSPYAYYCLLQSTTKSESTHDAEAYMKLDIPFSRLRSVLSQRKSRPAGATTATLTLTSVPKSTGIAPSVPGFEQRYEHGRPYFRLPGTSNLASLNHILLTRTAEATALSETSMEAVDAEQVWMLDFTDGGRSPGIIMTHSRMREIQQVIDPSSASSSMGLGVTMPPLSGNWFGLLTHPTLPPSGRYIALYTSPSDLHPPLRLRLTAPNEAGFKLERVPVRSLKEIYGILEVVRDQCWINELLQTVKWTPEDLVPGLDEDDNETDAMDAEAELQNLLEGSLKPHRINVNIFLPPHPPVISGPVPPTDFDEHIEDAVPGLSSISAPVRPAASEPCVALGFFAHSSGPASGETMGLHSGIGSRPRQAALVIRHDRTRKKGVRVDVSVTSTVEEDDLFGTTQPRQEHPPTQMIEELEETARRGGYFGVIGKVWTWLSAGAAGP